MTKIEGQCMVSLIDESFEYAKGVVEIAAVFHGSICGYHANVKLTNPHSTVRCPFTVGKEYKITIEEVKP